MDLEEFLAAPIYSNCTLAPLGYKDSKGKHFVIPSLVQCGKVAQCRRNFIVRTLCDLVTLSNSTDSARLPRKVYVYLSHGDTTV